MTGRPRLRRRIPPWGVDALLGTGVAVVVSVVISAGQAAEQPANALAYLWAVGLGALMLVRRRYPRIVLVVTTLGLFAYYASGYPAIGVAVPVAAALFSAGEAGRLFAAIATALVVLTVSVSFRVAEGQDPAFVLAYDLVGHVTLMAAAVALGDSLRSRRAVQAGERELAELYAQQARRDTERREHAERLAIARDLHDSVGHTASVISLHADVAREALAGDAPDRGAATRALDLIRQAATGTLTELRRTVALLRTPSESPSSRAGFRGDSPGGAQPGMSPAGSIRDVSTLTATARTAGITVETDLDVPDSLPATVDAAAYRIVQEAVTNAVRHSGARQVGIEVWAGDTRLHVAVTDDGPGGNPVGRPRGSSNSTMGGSSNDRPSGHGIAGMAERARALGGSLTAEREATGFAVRVELPLADVPREEPLHEEPREDSPKEESP